MGKSPSVQDHSAEVAAIQKQLQEEQMAVEAKNRADDQAREDAKTAQDKADAQAASDKKAADDAAALGKFNTDEQDAYGQSVANAKNLVTSKGLNYDDYGSEIERLLTNQMKSIPSLSPNVYNLFDPNAAVGTTLDNATNTKRSGYTQQLNQLFPDSYDQSLISDTSDDPILNAILTEQYNPAKDTLDRALARGQLNDSGYNSAIASLNGQRTSAQSKLNTVGSSVLGTDRQTINDIINSARSGASNYNLGQQFDPNSYFTRANSTAQDKLGSLEGDIRGAVGTDPLFSTGDLIQTGASSQGTVNNRGSLFDALLDSKKKTGTDSRGLGTQGAF